METKKLIKKIAVIGGLALMMGATFAGCTPSVQLPNGIELTQENLDAVINTAKQVGVESVDITADNENAVKTATNTLNEQVADLTEQAERDAQIIADYKTAEAEQEVEDLAVVEEQTFASNLWVSDELNLTGEYNYPLSDRKVTKLFDGEVEFDGDDYDAEESVTLTALKLDTNGNDYEDNVYLSM